MLADFYRWTCTNLSPTKHIFLHRIKQRSWTYNIKQRLQLITKVWELTNFTGLYTVLQACLSIRMCALSVHGYQKSMCLRKGASFYKITSLVELHMKAHWIKSSDWLTPVQVRRSAFLTTHNYSIPLTKLDKTLYPVLSVQFPKTSNSIY
jgi:hypothetical protein